MRLLAAVRVNLLVASDLLHQVGQEERANMGRQRSGRGTRNEVLETGKQARLSKGAEFCWESELPNSAACPEPENHSVSFRFSL